MLLPTTNISGRSATTWRQQLGVDGDNANRNVSIPPFPVQKLKKSNSSRAYI
jgi:hypothetical protein